MTATPDTGPPLASPLAPRLLQNYPNPFNPTTAIAYTLPEATYVRLTVFDVQGREVAVLREGLQAAGKHRATFNADGLPSGLYVYRLATEHHVATRAMLLVK